MPGMDGFQVMEGLKEIETAGYLPVLVITAQPDHKLRALRAGAKDFVSKPFDIAEVLTRVHNMLEVRLLHVEIHRKNAELKTLFDQVVAERKLSERLALHVPPESIAARLQARPDVTADSVADATVVIADVVGLAELTPTVSPEQLAVFVDEIFVQFDGLAQARGVKKIKTLGNSYMAVSDSTRRLLGRPFLLEERGALTVEGQGEIKTWFVGGRNTTEERHQSWPHEQSVS